MNDSAVGRSGFLRGRSRHLDDMAALLGEPDVMRHYPRPKTREEALAWIEVEGVTDLEVGYRVPSDLQGNGYATEAAAACRDHARDTLGAKRLIAIIRPDNRPSRRVAEKIGLPFERDAVSRSGLPVRIHATRL